MSTIAGVRGNTSPGIYRRRVVVIGLPSLAILLLALGLTFHLAARPLSSDEAALVGLWYTLDDSTPDSLAAVLLEFRADHRVTIQTRSYVRTVMSDGKPAPDAPWQAAMATPRLTSRWRRQGTLLRVDDPDGEPWWERVRNLVTSGRWSGWSREISMEIRAVDARELVLAVPHESDLKYCRVPDDFGLPDQPLTPGDAASPPSAP